AWQVLPPFELVDLTAHVGRFAGSKKPCSRMVRIVNGPVSGPRCSGRSLRGPRVNGQLGTLPKLTTPRRYWTEEAAPTRNGPADHSTTRSERPRLLMVGRPPTRAVARRPTSGCAILNSVARANRGRTPRRRRAATAQRAARPADPGWPDIARPSGGCDC